MQRARVPPIAALDPSISPASSAMDKVKSLPANTAIVFIKPHAVTQATITLVKEHLTAAGITITSEAAISSEEIEAKGLIDAHYGTLAELAMSTDPKELGEALSDSVLDQFELTFGVPWESAPLRRNGEAAVELGGLSGEELETQWRRGPFVKLAPGAYVARLVGDEVPGLPQGDRPITLNGFYPAMREHFLAPGTFVHCFQVSWNEVALSWSTFRQEIIGATDPATAENGSLRAAILANWNTLGLAKAPSMALNGVHASAGPLEGLKERTIWCGLENIADDPFGAALLQRDDRIDVTLLKQWMSNPVVTSSSSPFPVTDKIFDITEGLDSSEVLNLAPGFTRVA